MNMKSSLSVVALVAGLAFSGASFAQTSPTTIGGAEVSAEDSAAVAQRCSELNVASTTESLTASDDSSTGDVAVNAGTSDATVTTAPDTNEIQQDTSAVDLDAISLEDCTTDGWVTQ